MSIEALNWAFKQRLDDPTAKLVLLGIADKFNPDRGYAWPSIKRLAEMADCTERNVTRKLRYLEEAGYIETLRESGGKNKYFLHLTSGRDDTGVRSVRTPEVSTPLTSDVSQTIINNNLTINNVESAFKRFWDEVPKRDGKKPAMTAFKRALKTVSEDVLIDGMRAYANLVKSKGTERRYILMPATWLNQARWDDDLQAQEDVAVKETFGVAQKWMPSSKEDFYSKVMTGDMKEWYSSHRPDVITYAKENGWL